MQKQKRLCHDEERINSDESASLYWNPQKPNPPRNNHLQTFTQLIRLGNVVQTIKKIQATQVITT